MSYVKMVGYAWCLITGLAACQSAFARTTAPPGASLTPTSSAQTSTPTSNLPTFEIDVLFPRENETYNFISSLPIVFAFQNFTAAAELGPFTFSWDIMPYNTIDYPIPGGVTEDRWLRRFTSENASTFTTPDGSPYILINHTNPMDWMHGPENGGTAYSLRWNIHWDNIDSQCDRPRPDIGPSKGVKLLFTLLPAGPNQWNAPDPSTLGNVTDNCAQLGTFAMLDANNPDKCSMDQLLLGDGNPCAVKPDGPIVTSMSSAVASLSSSQSLATATPTTTDLPPTSNAAVATGVSIQPALAVAFVIGGWELFSL
jgi:hypothetical protein